MVYRMTWSVTIWAVIVSIGLSSWPISDDQLPRGLPEFKEPKENPSSPEKIALGKKLFFDKSLSRDGTVSCASCHEQEKNFATRDAKAIGINKQTTRRNAPSLLNRAFSTRQFWDGRTNSLEEQALQPLVDPLEMGNTMEKVLQTITSNASYLDAWKKAFGHSKPTEKEVGMAIAAYERSLVLGDSPVDAFVAGDVSKLKPQAKHGLWIFESRGKCWQCHSGKNYTDESFRNTGVSWGIEPLDLGRFEVTKDPMDKGKFKVPTLRGVALTAPFMHDGSLNTLEEVVAFYNKGGVQNPNLDSALKPLNLSKDEEADLVAFLKALSEVNTAK